MLGGGLLLMMMGVLGVVVEWYKLEAGCGGGGDVQDECREAVDDDIADKYVLFVRDGG